MREAARRESSLRKWVLRHSIRRDLWNKTFFDVVTMFRYCPTFSGSVYISRTLFNALYDVKPARDRFMMIEGKYKTECLAVMKTHGLLSMVWTSIPLMGMITFKLTDEYRGSSQGYNWLICSNSTYVRSNAHTEWMVNKLCVIRQFQKCWLDRGSVISWFGYILWRPWSW